MRSHVFNDAGLVKHAGRFVWLSIDTEQAGSAAFLERFPVEAWPTLFVIEPTTGAVAFKWLGSATAAQLEKILEDGERAARALARPAAPGAPALDAEGLLAQADLKYASGEQADAAGLYQAALEKGQAGWSRRPRAVERLVMAQLESGSLEDCARVALAQAPSLPRGPSFANAVGTGLSCAQAAEGLSWAGELAAGLEPLAAEAARLDSVLADDRSGLYEELVQCREAAKDEAGARRLAEEWLAYLEGEAARATTAEARSAFDAHRVLAALKLGEPARAIPALEQTERDLPGDYNAPARLAQLLLELKRFDEALAASARALAKAHGPRRMRLLSDRAGILEKKGDRDAARRAMQEALDFAASLPEVQRPAKQVERLQARLKELSGP